MHTPTMLLLLVSSEGSGGFDPMDFSGFGNAFWTFLIFFLAVPLIWKMVMGPIVGALQERDDQTANAIKEAKSAKEEAEKARAAAEVARGEAQAEVAKLMSEARERAEAREHEIIAAAKQEGANLIEAARAAIRAEQDKALSAIRAEVVDLSLHAATKVLSRNVESEDDRRVVEELVGGQASSN